MCPQQSSLPRAPLHTEVLKNHKRVAVCSTGTKRTLSIVCNADDFDPLNPSVQYDQTQALRLPSSCSHNGGFHFGPLNFEILLHPAVRNSTAICELFTSSQREFSSLISINCEFISLPRYHVEREGELEGVIAAVQGSNAINSPECDSVSLVPF